MNQDSIKEQEEALENLREAVRGAVTPLVGDYMRLTGRRVDGLSVAFDTRRAESGERRITRVEASIHAESLEGEAND